MVGGGPDCREDVGSVPLSQGHMSESVPGYCPDLGPVEPPVGRPRGLGWGVGGAGPAVTARTQRPGLYRCLLSRDRNAGWGERDSREGPAGFLRVG